MDKSITTADGLRLHLLHWPAAEPARGTVLIVHGLGEHSGRYAHVAAQLNLAGWHVLGYDHRGHGWSEGARGAVPDSEALLRDLAAVIDTCRSRLPTPLILLGHSIGGLVAARFVAAGLDAQRPTWWRDTDGLVLSSPALDPGMNAVQKLLLASIGPIAPDLALGNGLKPEWLSHEHSVVELYRNDSLVHDRITPRLVRFIVDGGRSVIDCAARWPLPTLLLYAGSDRCVAPRGSAAFAAAAPKAQVQARVFPAMFHEIFNEPGRGEVFALLTGWLAQREETVAKTRPDIRSRSRA